MLLLQLMITAQHTNVELVPFVGVVLCCFLYLPLCSCCLSRCTLLFGHAAEICGAHGLICKLLLTRCVISTPPKLIFCGTDNNTTAPVVLLENLSLSHPTDLRP